MATPKSQRIAIWIIAVVMAIGSLGFYFLIIIENNQQAEQQAQLQKQLQEAQKPAKALPGYEAKTFAADDVSKLTKRDLKKGSGKTVPAGANVKVNYMGWNPNGKIFDSSFKNEAPEPIEIQLGAVIKGWKEGVPGMKVGGIRELTIPADMAYGEQGSGEDIPPNAPLKFIVEVVSIEK